MRRNASYTRRLALLHQNPSAGANDDILIDNDDLEEEEDGLVVNNVWLYIAWMGLLVCLVYSFVCAYRNCRSERGPVASKKDDKVLPDEEERRLRLRKIFEECGAQMEILEGTLITSGTCDEEGSQQSAPVSTAVDEEWGKQNSVLICDDTLKDVSVEDDTGAEAGPQQAAGTSVAVLDEDKSGKSCPLLVLSARKEENAIKKGTKSESVPAVVGCCAICLQDYKVGEVVVWNCTPKSDCPHIYHRDCMIDYLVSYGGGEGGSPCPSCRRSYLDCSQAVCD